MKSTLLFISCFAFLMAAAYLGNTLLSGRFAKNTEIRQHFLALKRSAIHQDIISSDQVKWVTVPKAETENAFVTRTEFEEKGANFFTVNVEVQGGDLIRKDQIIWNTEPAFLSSVVRSGHRAIEMSFEGIKSLAPAILPGRKIDLLMVYKKNRSSVVKPLNSGTIVASGIRVLKNAATADHTVRQKLGYNFVLEVTERQAEFIAKAAEFGHLSPVIRSISEPTEEKINALSDYRQASLKENKKLAALSHELARNTSKHMKTGFTVIQRGSDITVLSHEKLPSRRVEYERPPQTQKRFQ